MNFLFIYLVSIGQVLLLDVGMIYNYLISSSYYNDKSYLILLILSINLTSLIMGKRTEEKVHFNVSNTQDGNTFSRYAIFVHYPDAKATVLICHGFMCNKYDVSFLRTILPVGQFNFLSFDFRAHGENTEGQWCSFGRDEAQEVIAAVDFLKNNPICAGKPIFAYAFSMGAVAAIEAQAQEGNLFDGMILDCPFDTSENVIKRGLDNLKLSIMGYEFELPGRAILQRYAFNPYVQTLIKGVLKTVAKFDTQNIQTIICPVSPIDSIKNVTVPCFFIHCKQDEKVSVDSIKNLYQAANGHKQLWISNGRGHYDSVFYNPERYQAKITKFIDIIMQGIIYKGCLNKVIIDNDDYLDLTTQVTIVPRSLTQEPL